MNKKIIVIVSMVALVMLLTPIVGTVMAGNGTNKMTFTITFEGQARVGPPIREDTGQTRHVFVAYATGPDGIIHLTVVGEDYFEYGVNYGLASDFVYYSEMHNERHNINDLEKDFSTMHWWYTLDFGEGNVITVMANGKNYLTQTGSDPGPPTSWGNIVGFGTGIFENLILKGTACHDEGVITHSGIIMGWPNP